METSLLTKLCSTCLLTRPLAEFYSKGNRQDSACKDCTKKRKRSTYVATKPEYSVENLNNALGLLLDFELARVERVNEQLREIINRVEQRTSRSV